LVEIEVKYLAGFHKARHTRLLPCTLSKRGSFLKKIGKLTFGLSFGKGFLQEVKRQNRMSGTTAIRLISEFLKRQIN